MTSVKEEARRLIDELPEDVDWTDVRLEIELREKMERGLADMAAGRVKPAAEIERKFGFNG
ncbi:MAG: hypothetical protein ACRDHF_11570 [Tepidiformaceae bacterium]